MLPSPDALKRALRVVIADRQAQGYVVDGLGAELDELRDGYDALTEFAGRLSDLPLREDWPYDEPEDLDGIHASSHWVDEPTPVDHDDAARRIRAGFVARVCGCMLGKPFEIDATFEEIRDALRAHGEWPLRDYPTETSVRALPRLQPQWAELVRDRIDHVAVDDDINYTVLAMLTLEEHGSAFTHDDLRRLWLRNLPVAATFGPERTTLLKMGLATLDEGPADLGALVRLLNPGDELCGALIRADAYGYACPGDPGRAADLAYKDASLTHRRTGVYGAMFVAACIAAAFVVREPLEIFRIARGYVPARSRFGEAIDGCLEDVAEAKDWIDGFERIRMRYGEFGFCRIYQEIGTVMNAVHFADDVGEGFCKQVMQGNDTDSFGATVGSILGVLLGPDHLDPRWSEPFRDDVHTALAMFHERSLDVIATRMSQLPRRVTG